MRLARDFDASGLRAIRDGDGDGEHSVFVGGVDLVGVEAVAEKELAAEGALSPFARDDLVAFDGLPVPLGGDRHGVAFDSEVDRRRVDARQVEVDHEAVAVAVGVHRDAGLAGLAPRLVEDTVELAQRVESHEHGHCYLQVRRFGAVVGFSFSTHNVGHYVDCQEGSRHDLVMVRMPGDPGASNVTLAVAGFLDACRSSNTRAAYRADLGHVAAWCRGRGTLNLLTIDAADVARYRTECELAGASAATVARRLSAITSFGAYAAANGTQSALAADIEIERPALESSSTAELLTDADAEALLAAADRISRRSAALIRLLMLDGLKVGEVIRADAADVRGRPPRMTLSSRSRTARTIDLHPDTATAVRRYLDRRRDGPLLLSERRGRRPGRLTRFGVDYLVKQVAQAAGLDQAVSGNTLRRRYVIAAHADGTDLDRIRRNAGHADRRTTRRYLDPDTPSRNQPVL